MMSHLELGSSEQYIQASGCLRDRVTHSATCYRPQEHSIQLRAVRLAHLFSTNNHSSFLSLRWVDHRDLPHISLLQSAFVKINTKWLLIQFHARNLAYSEYQSVAATSGRHQTFDLRLIAGRTLLLYTQILCIFWLIVTKVLSFNHPAIASLASIREGLGSNLGLHPMFGMRFRDLPRARDCTIYWACLTSVCCECNRAWVPVPFNLYNDFTLHLLLTTSMRVFM